MILNDSQRFLTILDSWFSINAAELTMLNQRSLISD